MTAVKPQVINLRPGDALVCGSDGKDDLEIDGNIDASEERFLLVVEKSRADLRKIDAALRAAGRFTDDVSLVRIAFSSEK